MFHFVWKYLVSFSIVTSYNMVVFKCQHINVNDNATQSCPNECFVQTFTFVRIECSVKTHTHQHTILISFKSKCSQSKSSDASVSSSTRWSICFCLPSSAIYLNILSPLSLYLSIQRMYLIFFSALYFHYVLRLFC